MAVAALVMFVVMFLVVFVARSLIQKRATGDDGIRAGVLGAAVGSLEWLAGWLLVVAFLAGLAAPIAEIAGIEPTITTGWLRGAGVIVAGLGIVVTFLAQNNMGAEWRIGIDTNEHTGLVTDGAFGLVRNPIFTAMIFTATGLALMVPNPISITGLILLIAAIELQVRFVEEPHLRRLHGNDYKSYASRVGRFMPGIGRS